LAKLLANPDFAADFIKKVQEMKGPNPDTRFRVREDENIVVKKENDALDGSADSGSGFHDCYFHIHDPAIDGAAMEQCHARNQLAVALNGLA
jgi:hypothetical protein